MATAPASNPDNVEVAAAISRSATTPRVRWTDEMVALLLRLRSSELSAQFLAADKHKHLLAVAWTALRVQFRARQPPETPPLNVTQLKNKWHALRKEHADIRELEVAAAPQIEYPSYWSLLSAAFSVAVQQVPTAVPRAAATPMQAAERLTPVQPSSPLTATSAGSRLANDSARDSSSSPTGDEEPPLRKKERRLRWTDKMITVLLELRLRVLRESFNQSTSPASRKAVWMQLHDRFCVQLRLQIDVLQLKNKFSALRKEFIAGSRDNQKRQGADGETFRPSYWHILGRYFAGEIDASVVQGGGMARLLAPKATGIARSSEPADPTPPRSTTHSARFGSVPRMQWGTRMISTLLELRLREFGGEFASNRAPAALKSLWEQLRLKFALEFNLTIEAVQLKNKYNALRKEYFDGKAQQLRDSDEQPHLPVYWDTLLDYFGEAEDDHGAFSASDEPSRLIFPGGKRRREEDLTEDQRSDLADAIGKAETDPVRHLIQLVERQSRQNEELCALMRRQTEQFDKVMAESAALNNALLQLVQTIGNQPVLTTAIRGESAACEHEEF